LKSRNYLNDPFGNGLSFHIIPALRFSEEQIINVIKEAAGGIPVPEICRKHGISSWTFYRWRKRYSGLEVSEAKRLRELEAENARLKRLVANYALDNQVLKLSLRRRKRKRRSGTLREAMPIPAGPNEVWSADFIRGDRNMKCGDLTVGLLAKLQKRPP
jgi:putative transposase